MSAAAKSSSKAAAIFFGSSGTIYRGCLPFCGTILAAIVAVTALPDIALALPKLFFG